MIALRLERPMPSALAPDWPGALWVGTVDLEELSSATVGDTIALADSAGYPRARLLVRHGARVLGFVELAITELPAIGGGVALDDLWLAIGELPELPASVASPLDLPRFTVVLCTRDRADQLRGALRSVLDVDYPFFEVVVVDNAGATDATRRLVVDEFDDPRITFVSEPVPGLASARNAGLREAHGEMVAFTDDDVIVDRWWLRGLAAGFARAEDVTCVSGLVPSGELRTPVQRFFDDRVSWSRNLAVREFRLSEQPADLPMFPFSVGEFGTGANFALRRDRALRMGGFDTAFGVGTRTGGGEDLDMFTRVLFAGGALVVEPSAIVWHRHRSDLDALRAQAVGYGTGLGAWLTKVAFSPTMFGAAVARGPRALRRLLAKGGGTLEPAPAAPTPADGVSGASDGRRREAPDDTDWARAVSRVGWLELASVAMGPWRYLRQRWDGAGVLDEASRTRRGTAVTKVRSRERVTGAGLAAIVVGLLGLAGVAAGVPTGLAALLVAALVLLGPGLVLLTWLPLSRAVAGVMVPALGLSVVLLGTGVMAATAGWYPRAFLVGLAALTVVGGFSRWVKPVVTA
jgi:GT2 family glycosyltransferase